MGKIHRHLALAFILFVFASIESRQIYADTIEYQAHREAIHFKNIATDTFMKVLAIKPGMTILDIGTGTGQFAYEFAERLKGTGKVFATDIDIKCINQVKQEAGKRGFTNLQPVLVKEEGLDEFYGRQKYDLITLFHVPISNKYEYLNKLRDFLEEDGRLIILLYKNALPFSLDDFSGDFKGLVKGLLAEPVDSPFYHGLRGSTRESIKQNAASEPDNALKNAIVEDLNLILYDNHFGSKFVDGSVLKKEVDFSSEESDFANYLLMLILEEKIFDSNQATLNSKQMRVVKRFNKLLIIQKFRKYLHKDRMFKSRLTSQKKADFEKAGYKLDKEYTDVIPFENILVFTSDKRQKENK